MQQHCDVNCFCVVIKSYYTTILVSCRQMKLAIKSTIPVAIYFTLFNIHMYIHTYIDAFYTFLNPKM